MTVRLTELQRTVVHHGDGPLLVVSGPGAGKTRVLVERVRRLLQEPGHFRVLALTFTNKAANEMKERLQDVPQAGERVFVGTMHGFCMEVLENRGRSIGFVNPTHIFESFADRKEVLAEAVQNDPNLAPLLIDAGGPKEQARVLAEWLDCISDYKSNLLLPDLIDDPTMRAIYEAYDAGLTACAAIDFNDLLLLAYRIFEEAPKIAAFYRRQYRYVCVDEAQDINEAQYRVLCSLCGESHRNVMLVGDPKQSIYVWNGASPKYLDLFQRDFRAKVIRLDENFRSSRAVIAAAQALNPNYSTSGQVPLFGGLSVQRCNSEAAEATYVINKLADLQVNGHPDLEESFELGKAAVLGRNRYVFAELERHLKDAGMPYYTKLASGAYRSESSLVRQFELALRVFSNPHDRIHLGRLSQEWGLGKSANEVRATLNAKGPGGSSIVEAMAARSNAENAETVVSTLAQLNPVGDKSFKLRACLDALEKAAASFDSSEKAMVLRDLQTWRGHWDTFVKSRPGGTATLQQFLIQMALGTTEQPRGDGVALLTVHSAKGLEFDVVFLIGLCEGVFPDYRARGTALEEETRSAFVGVTRAKRLLFATCPMVRMMPWGEPQNQQPSRYLKAFEQVAQSLVSGAVREGV